MIDEELYQQASEELASERRDLRVWARACSLAPEDHDEARYLYTNLRVEELLAERDEPRDGHVPESASPAAPAPEPDLATGAAAVPDSNDNDRGDVGADRDIDILFAALEDEDDGDERHAVVESSALDDTDPEPCAADLVPDESRSADRESAERTDVERRELTPQTERRDSPFRADDARDPDSNAAAAAAAAAADDDDDDDFDWLGRDRDAPGERIDRDAVRTAPAPERASDESGRQEARGGIADETADDRTDALELGRQRRDLPFDPDEAASRSLAPARAPTPSAPSYAEPEWARPTYAREEPSDERTDAFVSAPLELDTGRGSEYAVYRRDGSREQAVKRGGSIGALFLTVPWLLYRQLFGTTLLYLLFAVAVLAGLTMTGLSWIDAGAAVPLQTKGATVAFALLALFGLFVAPWRQGNRWRQEKLERRGFSLVAHVRAPNAKAALLAAERAARNHPDPVDASPH